MFSGRCRYTTNVSIFYRILVMRDAPREGLGPIRRLREDGTTKRLLASHRPPENPSMFAQNVLGHNKFLTVGRPREDYKTTTYVKPTGRLMANLTAGISIFLVTYLRSCLPGARYKYPRQLVRMHRMNGISMKAGYRPNVAPKSPVCFCFNRRRASPDCEKLKTPEGLAKQPSSFLGKRGQECRCMLLHACPNSPYATHLGIHYISQTGHQESPHKEPPWVKSFTCDRETHPGNQRMRWASLKIL